MKWIFENRVYSSLEELSGKTMSNGSLPKPLFTLDEMMDAFHREISFGSYIDSKYKIVVDEFSKLISKVDVGEGAESESEL